MAIQKIISTGKIAAVLMTIVLSVVFVVKPTFAQSYNDPYSSGSSYADQMNQQNATNAAEQTRQLQNNLDQYHRDEAAQQQQQRSGWQPLGGTPLSPPPASAPPPFGNTPPLGGTDLRGPDIR